MKRIFVRLISAFVVILMLFSSFTAAAAEYSFGSTNGNKLALAPLGAYNLDTPQNIKLTVVEKGIKISWDKVSGASKYRVYYINSKGQWEGLGNTKALNYTHTGLESERTYTYTVRCLNSKGVADSDFNRQGVSAKFLSSPEITSLSYSGGGINIKWQASESVKRVRVYKRINGSSWVRVSVVQSNSYTDTDVVSGNTYTYTVRGIDENDEFITYCTSGKKITYLDTPEISKIEVTSSGIKVAWKAVSAAKSYRVYYINSQGVWQGLANTASTTYIHKNLTFGNTYTYTVRSLNSSSTPSSDYNRKGVSVAYNSTPSITSVSNTNEGVKIKWSGVEGITKYRLFRKTPTTTWARVGDFENFEFTDKSVESGASYTYTVRGVDDKGNYNSYYNTSGSTTTYFTAPVITKAENTATGTKITWDAVSGVSKYRVYYINDAGNWQGISNTTETSFTHNDLESGKTYTYTVRCLNSSGATVSDYIRSGYSTTFYAPPVVESVDKSELGVTVSWAEVSGVSGYALFRKSMGGQWVRLTTTTNNYFNDTTVDCETLCTYTLRYVDESGKYLSYYLNDTCYYLDGVLANGTISVNGNNCYFVDGKLRSGYQTIGDKKYYYNENGVIQKNAIVGSDKEGWYYADANGVCCESEEIVYAVSFVKQYGKGTTSAQQLRSCYNALVTYRYERVLGLPKSGDDFRNMAIKMFRDKAGNCFCYAAAFSCVAKVLGYDTKVVSGKIAAAGGGLTAHGWSQVNYNGSWLICDPDMQKESKYYNYYMCTFAQYPVKPLVTETTYNLTITDGVAVWK